MLKVKDKTDGILKDKNISYYKLSELVDYDEGYLSKIFNGKNSFPKPLIKKLLPILEVSHEEFESWIVADKYSEKVLKLAIRAKKDFPYKRKSILTAKIDAVLQERNLSRRAFAKQVIDYEQSGFNQMVVGKRNMSPAVLEKTANAFGVDCDVVLSWVVADRYNLPVLERALGL